MISVGTEVNKFAKICLTLEVKFGYDSLAGLVVGFPKSLGKFLSETNDEEAPKIIKVDF